MAPQRMLLWKFTENMVWILNDRKIVFEVLHTFQIDYPLYFMRSRNKTTDRKALKKQVVLLRLILESPQNYT